MWDILVKIFPYAIAYTIPMLITALGALYCERSGIINLYRKRNTRGCFPFPQRGNDCI